MTNSQRLQHLRIACDLKTREDFAILCQRTRAQVNAYMRGECWPPSDVMARIRERLVNIKAQYDLEWLIPSEVTA